MTTFAEKVKKAKLAERTVELCLRGDLQAKFENLVREFQEAAGAGGGGRLVGNAEARRLAEEIELLRMEMADSIQVFTLRAMKRGRWSALCGEHPPVAEDKRQAALGYNPDTFFPDAIRKSIVDPVEATVDDDVWEAFLDSISDAQYNELVACAQLLNQKPVSIPFWPAASAMIQGSASGSSSHGG